MITEPQPFLMGQLSLFDESAPTPEPASAKAPKRRKAKPRPPEKTLEEIEANAARFRAWQRGERQAPAVWDVTDQWIRTYRE